MALWKNAEIETYYANEGPSDRSRCEVRITGGEIAVSIQDEQWAWRGSEDGPGHYKLTRDGGGRAILHRSPDSDALDGYWIAEGWEGMCRIELNDLEQA